MAVSMIVAVVVTTSGPVNMSWLAMGRVDVAFFLVAMCVAARGVGAALWLKRGGLLCHRQVHGTQHVGQHMVGFNFEVVRLQFDLNVPVAQVIGRTSQVKGAAMF